MDSIGHDGCNFWPVVEVEEMSEKLLRAHPLGTMNIRRKLCGNLAISF